MENFKLYEYICTHKVDKEWITEMYYYAVDPSTVDLSTDWRFCKFPEKREQLISTEKIYNNLDFSLI